MAKQFRTGIAFKQALEAHLRRRTAELGTDNSTLQLKFAMERFVARLFAEDAPPWLLKGGFAMDMRFRPRARTTKDVDHSMPLTDEMASGWAGLLLRLKNSVAVDLGDFITYSVGEPKGELTNAPEGGFRFPCEVFLATKLYARFHLDIGFGDARAGAPERLTGDDLLAFAGVPAATVLAISKAQQFAEKVHAYTFPWVDRTNSRTKDLVDLVLLIERGDLVASELKQALAETFAVREGHPLPEALTPPPDAWGKSFGPMAAEAGLTTTDYLEAYAILERYWIDNGLGGPK